MASRIVKLVKNAQKLAVEKGAGLALFTHPEQVSREVDKDREVTVTSREYHRLKDLGLIEESRLVAPAADQPEADAAREQSRQDLMDANAAQRTGDQSYTPAKVPARAISNERGPSGTNRGVHPGGVGHQPGDGYGPARIQSEIAADVFRGLLERAGVGLPVFVSQSMGMDQSKSKNQSKPSTQKGK